ncbi:MULTISPECIES: GNAT family N-acetyltransferase [Streptococcus]|uniref:Acetyltransferase n=2 Tax=Streptococcus thermophilus TaxID=1308 RepID=A0A7U7H4K6_STRTR|nr:MULTISPECIES: GNAT family N-acetyltransferase [Streptococcus]CCF01613.1 Acetyltransferase [Streptococcus macedonicus ACA-DC 198]PHV59190.1 N-acetyltransferase [Streptococcus macedonicus]CAD0145021.1 Acetyltransferase [Streptococcus thermophilus]CAD0146385.1 Acetyltransferase [Streptococcus thermophilus]CAD0148798.1 Acetyltransferase [Streptococcus thermophilus]
MIKFKRVTKYNTDKKEKDQLKKLYLKAFPAEKRLPFFFFMTKTKDENVDFLSIYDDDSWISMIYLVKHDKLTFISYFAIDDSLRSKGYGGQVLEEIKKKYSNYAICLTFEKIDSSATNNEQRIKRKDFYKRNGFDKFNFYIKEAGIMYEFISHEKVLNPLNTLL